MRILNMLIFLILTLATILGIYGQGIAYFMNEKNSLLGPVDCLTIVTFTSVLLYLIIFVLTYVISKKKKIDKSETRGYFLMISLIGIPISLWSLSVLSMWWG